MTSIRPLDFIIIGTQKGGTTSLWQYLRSHPAIYLPTDKEIPFFSRPGSIEPEDLAKFMERHFDGAEDNVLLGKATPHYMLGNDTVPPGLIARRIALAFPKVRIIALLRDPIERAISHHRMSTRRGIEARSFGQAAHDLLTPTQLAMARKKPTETNSYIVQGEYGRILAAYFQNFPSSKIHVEFTFDLASEPENLIDRVLEFLELEPGHRPQDLGVRHHTGGLHRRVDHDAEKQLRAFLSEHVWGRLGRDSEQMQHAFNFFWETWNIAPDNELPSVSPRTRKSLEAHYVEDVGVLASLGIEVPWPAVWLDRKRSL